VTVAVSYLLDPPAWQRWAEILRASNSAALVTPGWYLDVPLLVRLPIAAAIVVVAARLDRPWLVPVATFLALPVLWLNGLAVLAACWPLRRGVASRLAAAESAQAPAPVLQG
jgi:hypothetical protein